MSQENAEVQAPEVAPVTPEAPAKPTAPVAEPPANPELTKQEPTGAIEYESTGNARLDYTLSFIARAGIDAEHPAMIAAAEGDLGLLKATLAEKGVPGWEQAIKLGEEALEELRKGEEEKLEQVRQSVVQVAEALGVDWEAAVTYARDNGAPEEIEKINGMLGDPFTAKIAAFYIANVYRESANVDVPPQKSPVKPEAVAAQAGQQGGTISRAEFAAEVGKLHKRFGDSYNQTPEYRALAARLQR